MVGLVSARHYFGQPRLVLFAPAKFVEPQRNRAHILMPLADERGDRGGIESSGKKNTHGNIGHQMMLSAVTQRRVKNLKLILRLIRQLAFRHLRFAQDIRNKTE